MYRVDFLPLRDLGILPLTSFVICLQSLVFFVPKFVERVPYSPEAVPTYGTVISQ